MNESLGFKITVEYICPNMISADDLEKEYGGSPTVAYIYISDNYSDSPDNFATRHEILKVELLEVK
jgi:hypothetical protein